MQGSIYGQSRSLLKLSALGKASHFGLNKEFSLKVFKVVLQGYPRCPNSHDLSECHQTHQKFENLIAIETAPHRLISKDSLKVCAIQLNNGWMRWGPSMQYNLKGSLHYFPYSPINKNQLETQSFLDLNQAPQICHRSCDEMGLTV